MRTLAVALALALALGGAGCVANVKDLKDRLEPASTDATPVAPTAHSPSPTAPVAKPPVARMAVYAESGALLYQSTFTAEDMANMIMPVEPNTTLTLVGTDSEALAQGAKIQSYQWDVAGAKMAGPKTEANFTGPGKYPVTLTVTDSLGGRDSQIFLLAVQPKAYNVSTNLTTGPIVGAGGAGQDGSAVFEVQPPAGGQIATIENARVLVAGVDTCDVVLTVTANGKTAGSSDNAGLGGAEAVDLASPPVGKYTVTVAPGEACAAKDGVTVQVIVTYLPMLV